MKVKYFAYIRNYTKSKEIDFQYCKTVEELLLKLSDYYGKKFRNKIFKENVLSDEIIILVNGRHIVHLNGIHTNLNEEDEICIFPVVAGG
jgi:molybdopterin synthase sulfur carrier subunit